MFFFNILNRYKFCKENGHVLSTLRYGYQYCLICHKRFYPIEQKDIKRATEIMKNIDKDIKNGNNKR